MANKKDFQNQNETSRLVGVLKQRKQDLTKQLEQIKKIENLIGERVFSATLEMDKIDQLMEISGISLKKDKGHYEEKANVLKAIQKYESYSFFKLNKTKQDLKRESYDLTKEIIYYENLKKDVSL